MASTRSRTGASSTLGIAAVLHESHDLLPEIINHVAALEGLRALPRVAAVCKHWQRVAVSLAHSWAALKYAGPAFPLVTNKPTKASFVCSMPTRQARGHDARGEHEQEHTSLVVASVGKDIRILCPRSGVALAEIQTAAGVWPSGLACDGRHLFAAGSLDCTVYKLEIGEGAMEIVEACGGFGSGETGSAAGKTGLHSPQGLALHGETLFIADSGNGRVAVWDATPRLRYRRSIGCKAASAKVAACHRPLATGRLRAAARWAPEQILGRVGRGAFGVEAAALGVRACAPCARGARTSFWRAGRA